MIFAGEYEYRIDPQGRTSVPARFRPAFETGIVLSRGYDRCLMVYTTEGFTRLAGEIGRQSATRSDARKLGRLTFAGAYELALDRHGRVLVPGPLREYAGLDEAVVFIGVGRFLEIWSREAWDEERSSLDDEAAEIAERAGEPGIVEEDR